MIPDNVRDALMAYGASGWVSDLTDGRPNTPERVKMYIRFLDEDERGALEYRTADPEHLKRLADARDALRSMLSEVPR